MPTIFARARVADYEIWREVYDVDRPRRAAASLREVGVYRDTDDPNMVLMVWDATGTDGFMKMLGSAALHDKMKEADVRSVPETWDTVKLLKLGIERERLEDLEGADKLGHWMETVDADVSEVRRWAGMLGRR